MLTNGLHPSSPATAPNHSSQKTLESITDLAHGVSLARLALQAVLLSVIVLVASSSRFSVSRRVLGDVILVALQLLLVHLIQDLHAQLDITQELVASALAEVLSDHHSQHLQVVGVGSHRVGWHNPASSSELVGEGEFIIMLSVLLIEAESDEWQACAVLLGHDDEA